MATDSVHTTSGFKSGITFHSESAEEGIVVPASAQTMEGFRTWAQSDQFPDRGKITYVAGGLLIDMSPESLEKHSEIKTEICRVMANIIRQQKLGRLHIDGVLFTNTEAGVSNEPDALFVSRELLSSDRLTLTPAKNCPGSSTEIVGTVDWVLEIVSPSSVRKDTVLLRKAYYQAGVKEYWLIDATHDEINFQILTRGASEYVVNHHNKEGWSMSPTFGKNFRLAREEDEEGFMQYTLHELE